MPRIAPLAQRTDNQYSLHSPLSLGHPVNSLSQLRQPGPNAQVLAPGMDIHYEKFRYRVVFCQQNCVFNSHIEMNRITNTVALLNQALFAKGQLNVPNNQGKFLHEESGKNANSSG